MIADACGRKLSQRLLPNYGVFDEQRYSRPATNCVVEIAGVRCGVTIGEDIWAARRAAQEAGAQVLLVMNGFPYQHDHQRRAKTGIRCAGSGSRSAADRCTGMVGGQDELIFDGGSMVVAADGEVVQRAPAFEDAMLLVDLEIKGSAVRPLSRPDRARARR